MKRVGHLAGLSVGFILLLPACSRQPLSPDPKENAQSLPFNNASHSEGISPTEAFASSSIPAGTAIVIRLRDALSSAQSHSGDQFHAELDGPIVVQGQILVPSGTAITGRIVGVRASRPQEPGYLRLTLSSIDLKGKAMDLHCSAVFSKGGPHARLVPEASAASDVQFSTGRRLTFRLIQPLPLEG